MKSDFLQDRIDNITVKAMSDLVDHGSYYIRYDLNMRRTEVNWSPEFLKMTGYDEREFPAMLESWICKIHPDERNSIVNKFESAMARKDMEPVIAEYRFLTRSKNYKWFRSIAQLELEPDKKSYICFGIITDISGKKNHEELKHENKEHNQYLQSIANVFNTLHVLKLTDNSFVQIKVRGHVAKIINPKNKADVELRTAIEKTVTPSQLKEALAFTDLSTLSKRMEKKDFIDAEFFTTTIGWIRLFFIADKRNSRGNLVSVLVGTLNIDKEKKIVEQLKEVSEKDGLTGVLNRHSLDEEFKKLQKKRLADDFAIVVADLNGLKQINDTYGHDAGDELIKAFVECLKKAVGDSGSIYRAGGDEFVVIANASVELLAERRTLLRQFMSEWKHSDFRLSASLGYARAAEFPNTTIQTMLKVADQRMYADKKQFYALNGGQQVLR